MSNTTPTPTRTPTGARPARPPLPQLLCPLTRYGPHRRKPKVPAKPQAQAPLPPDPPPPPSPAASYRGATMRIAVTADERVVGVEQFDCLPDQQGKKEKEAEAEHKAADGWVEVDLTAEAEEVKEEFGVVSLEEEIGGRKTLLKDSDVERVMLETERDMEVFVKMVRAQGRRVERWAGLVGLGGLVGGGGKAGGEKAGGGEEEVVKGRWGP
ncbi:uncharacterized protein LAJ45_04376 [Morchella importuna]|uniref:uncharacterized protein n=1 Tax=Morchella importuna TaxID=1174673 RepID=UPI001E8DF221|nr:uncharacterized protein LAJ45_04376 [Morchella importuna]KAH8151754.1 hypothetical protein LAJ45_04376 [Morchella importuna]